MITDEITGVEQKCFIAEDGFWRCNFVVRRGKVQWTKSGKWWRFPALFFVKKKNFAGNEVNLSKES